MCSIDDDDYIMFDADYDELEKLDEVFNFTFRRQLRSTLCTQLDELGIHITDKIECLVEDIISEIIHHEEAVSQVEAKNHLYILFRYKLNGHAFKIRIDSTPNKDRLVDKFKPVVEMFLAFDDNNEYANFWI